MQKYRFSAEGEGMIWLRKPSWRKVETVSTNARNCDGAGKQDWAAYKPKWTLYLERMCLKDGNELLDDCSCCRNNMIVVYQRVCDYIEIILKPFATTFPFWLTTAHWVCALHTWQNSDDRGQAKNENVVDDIFLIQESCHWKTASFEKKKYLIKVLKLVRSFSN